MWSIFKFQYHTWIKNPGSLFSFAIPLLLLLVMAPMTASGSVDLTTITGNIITINLISTGLMGFGFSMFELKKSVIFKRIGSTQVTKSQAILGFISWYFVVGILSVLFTIFFAWIFSASVSGYYSTDLFAKAINIGGLVYGVTFGLILSLAIGFFFVSISRSLEVFNMYTMLYFFFATFVGGLFFPSSGGSQPQYQWMTYIGYAIPHTYIAGFLTASFQGADVWNIANGYVIQGIVPQTVQSWEATLDIFMPLACIGLFFGMSIKTFKWDR